MKLTGELKKQVEKTDNMDEKKRQAWNCQTKSWIRWQEGCGIFSKEILEMAAD